MVESGESFHVEDANGRQFGFTYYNLREIAGTGQEARLTRDEARRIVSNFAKLPELLKARAMEGALEDAQWPRRGSTSATG